MTNTAFSDTEPEHAPFLAQSCNLTSLELSDMQSAQAQFGIAIISRLTHSSRLGQIRCLSEIGELSMYNIFEFP